VEYVDILLSVLTAGVEPLPTDKTEVNREFLETSLSDDLVDTAEEAKWFKVAVALIPS